MIPASPGTLARRLGALALLTILASRADAYTVSFRISSTQEVPSSGTAGTGFGTVTVNTAANTLTFSITYSGLSASETAAHIHGPAAPGVNAGVLFTLPAGSPKNGVWNYPEAQETNILAGLTYVNIHTTAFPGGEIRGQIPRGDCSGPVSRAQAAEAVKGGVILTRSDHAAVEAFGPPTQVLAGTVIYDGTTDTPIVTVPANSWYFWIDDRPDQLFAHRVRHVLVNASTGCITHVINGNMWPIIGATVYYKSYLDRLTSPDRIWPAVQPPVPDHGLKGALPSWPELFGREKTKSPEAIQAGTQWAILIAAEDTSGAGSDPRMAKDLARVRRALSDKNANGPKVPDANIQFAAGMTLASLCTLIQNAPHNCDKMYIYWIGHGKEQPPGGVFFKDGTVITPEKWIQKIDSLQAKEYCIFMNSCFSGRFIKAFTDSGLSGSMSTGADSLTEALMYRDGIGKGEGGVYGHALAWCLEQGKTGAQLDQCIRDSIAKYVANRNSKVADGGLPYPNPQFVETHTFTGPGDFGFNSADSCKTVCIQFKGSGVCANSTLYCLTNNPPNPPPNPAWKCVAAWNWNVGETRYFPTGSDPNSTGQYKLSMHSNGYPVRIVVTWLKAVMPATPSSVPNFPAWALGFNDNTVEFGNIFAPAATVNLGAGLYFSNIPSMIGNIGVQNLIIREPLQGDPSRPFMHQNGDPSQPFSGPQVLVLGATNIQGPGGEPVTALPVQVQVNIDGNPWAGGGGQFQAGTVNASGVTPEGITPATATISLPPLRAGMVDFSIQIPPGAGTATLDYMRLDFVGPPTGVPGGPLTHTVRLVAYPNPGPGRTNLVFELPREGQARIRVYDITGRLVRTVAEGTLSAGLHTRTWRGESDDGGKVRSGLYYIQLEAYGERYTRRVALLE